MSLYLGWTTASKQQWPHTLSFVEDQKFLSCMFSTIINQTIFFLFPTEARPIVPIFYYLQEA
jgi:hypothetical protein